MQISNLNSGIGCHQAFHNIFLQVSNTPSQSPLRRIHSPIRFILIRKRLRVTAALLLYWARIRMVQFLRTGAVVSSLRACSSREYTSKYIRIYRYIAKAS